MGEIWTADHLTLSTKVAVKLIVDERADVELAGERLAREARLPAQLDSPHVVRHFDHGVTEEGGRYIVMELLHGQTLDERCDEGPLDVAEALQVIDEVGSALECAARRAIVHRDVKPDNIFLCDTPTGFFCKLLDFGVATEPSLDRRHSSTLPGTMVGTPRYMSPEMILGTRGPHHRDDLWALATVAYECLLGVQPFRGGILSAVCMAIANRDYARPSELDHEIGPPLDGFFAVAFAEQPEDRFETVGELLTSLHRALDRDAPRSVSVVAVARARSTGSSEQPSPSARGPQRTDVLPSVSSAELIMRGAPVLDHRWSPLIAGVVTAALLSLPLLFEPRPRAGAAVARWSALAMAATPAPGPETTLPQDEGAEPTSPVVSRDHRR